jgi:hypothetical protein
MPGQSGSEVRVKQIVRTTRWDEAQFAQLQAIAAFSGCSEAEVLRRLVARATKRIIITRHLVAEVNRLGVNINQIARRLNSGAPVSPAELTEAYQALLAAVTVAKS